MDRPFVSIDASFTLDEEIFKKRIEHTVQAEVAHRLHSLSKICVTEAIDRAIKEFADEAIAEYRPQFDAVVNGVKYYVEKQMKADVEKYLKVERNPAYNMSIKEFIEKNDGLLSGRCKNALKSYFSLPTKMSVVISMDISEFRKIPNFGMKSFRELEKALLKNKLKIGVL
jgi:hypothetical protein